MGEAFHLLKTKPGEQGGRRRGGPKERLCAEQGGAKARGEKALEQRSSGRRGEQEIFCIVRIVCAQEMGGLGRLFGNKILKGTCAEASCINGGQPMEE